MIEPVSAASGVTWPRGFSASGISVGIKKSGRKDLALVVSDRPASAVGYFTSNRVCAAPVKLSRRHLADGQAQAILINSGNANAGTGKAGAEAANRLAETAANLLDMDPRSVLVASTGVIGVPLPVGRIEDRMGTAVAELSETGGDEAAEAIMTTDRWSKVAGETVSANGFEYRVGAMAKGAGMIAPSLVPHATMIAVLVTDAPMDRETLGALAGPAVESSFNRITVDGDQSTNDTVFCLANGAAGGPDLASSPGVAKMVAEAMEAVVLRLAKMIVRDGEGSSVVVTFEVNGAVSDEQAIVVGRSVAESLLVKTAVFGRDPNWGRIIAAVGASGADIDPDKVDISIAGVQVCRSGTASRHDRPELETTMAAADDLTVEIGLNMGPGAANFYGCDLGHEYVKVNSEYTT